MFAMPRPMPRQLQPFLAGAAVVALALPVFLVAGLRVEGWALGAVLWLAARGLGVLLGRLRLGGGDLAGSGVVGIGMMFRAIAVMVVVIAIAASDAELG